MFILLTDGRSASGNKSEIVGKEVRMINKVVKIPIFTIGVGFDANMEFLENVAGNFLTINFVKNLNLFNLILIFSLVSNVLAIFYSRNILRKGLQS